LRDSCSPGGNAGRRSYFRLQRRAPPVRRDHRRTLRSETSAAARERSEGDDADAEGHPGRRTSAEASWPHRPSWAWSSVSLVGQKTFVPKIWQQRWQESEAGEEHHRTPSARGSEVLEMRRREEEAEESEDHGPG